MSVGSRPLVPSRLSPGGVAAHGARKEPKSVLGGYIVLMKLRVVELLLITTVPTMVPCVHHFHTPRDLRKSRRKVRL